MINPAFAKLLAETAVFLEMSGDNPFRIRAYQKAVQTIEDYPVDLGSLAREDLLKIPGIGQGIADKIQEFAKTGRVKEHDALLKKFPAGLMELMRVPGLGPKRARFLYDELQVDSCAKLAKLAAAGKLSGLKGFGAKMQENIVKGLQSAARGDGRMLLWKARKLMAPLLAKLAEVRGVTAVEPAGSLRRGRETVGDLDILCASRRPEAVIEFFTKMPSVLRVLAAGDKKASVLFYDNVQCDLRVVDPSVFGAALQYFTGSKEHNVVLRERAQRLGLTVNEYGVFRLSDKKQLKPLAAEKEEDVYKVLGLQYIPPELRENRGEIEAAEKSRLPRLVEEKDIKGCFHNHTDASDGADTLEAMAEAACAKGWEWFVSADHSPSLKVARGLEPARLLQKMERVKALNAKRDGFRLLCGSEVDILEEGRLDYPDEILAKLDVVVGSVHSGFKQPRERITGRIARAMENPHLDCVGHLTGRLLNRRDAYEVDVDAVLAAAARTGTALEINGQPDRQDINDGQALEARRRGVMLAANTDAHSTAELGYMSNAVTVARRAWLAKEDILNTKSWKELSQWLK